MGKVQAAPETIILKAFSDWRCSRRESLACAVLAGVAALAALSCLAASYAVVAPLTLQISAGALGGFAVLLALNACWALYSMRKEKQRSQAAYEALCPQPAPCLQMASKQKDPVFARVLLLSSMMHAKTLTYEQGACLVHFFAHVHWVNGARNLAFEQTASSLVCQLSLSQQRSLAKFLCGALQMHRLQEQL